MAGFTMPKRGSGAAMLRDLREDERPPLQDAAPQDTPLEQNASLEEDLTSGDASSPTSADTRSPVLEAFPTADQPEAGAAPTHLPSQSYDNMTNHMTDKQTTQNTRNQTANPVRKKTVKPSGQPSSQTGSRSVNPVASQAKMTVADMIRRRAAQRGEQEVLKTVTLKLSPSLDEKVERYCFDNKMKKQEFWAEAAALYFEMIAEGDRE